MADENRHQGCEECGHVDAYPEFGTDRMLCSDCLRGQRRHRGPELGNQNRLDIVEEDGFWSFEWTNVAGSQPISDLLKPDDVLSTLAAMYEAARRALGRPVPMKAIGIVDSVNLAAVENNANVNGTIDLQDAVKLLKRASHSTTGAPFEDEILAITETVFEIRDRMEFHMDDPDEDAPGDERRW